MDPKWSPKLPLIDSSPFLGSLNLKGPLDDDYHTNDNADYDADGDENVYSNVLGPGERIDR